MFLISLIVLTKNKNAFENSGYRKEKNDFMRKLRKIYWSKKFTREREKHFENKKKKEKYVLKKGEKENSVNNKSSGDNNTEENQKHSSKGSLSHLNTRIPCSSANILVGDAISQPKTGQNSFKKEILGKNSLKEPEQTISSSFSKSYIGTRIKPGSKLFSKLFMIMIRSEMKKIFASLHKPFLETLTENKIMEIKKDWLRQEGKGKIITWTDESSDIEQNNP